MAAKPPPVEPVRHYAPRGIAALVAPVVRAALRRQGVALAALLEDWPTIAGPEIAARSLPLKCAAGTLTIGCAGPDALELQHRAPALIARINLALGGGSVARLRFTNLPEAARAEVAQTEVAQTEVVWAETQRPGLDSASPADRSALPDGPVGDALARLARGLGTRRSI